MRRLLIGVFFFISSNALADIYWIDVRTATEFNQAHLDGAINIPFNQIIEGVKARGINLDDELYLYCRSGRRAGIAIDVLKHKGYKNMTNLKTLESAKAFKNNQMPK